MSLSCGHTGTGVFVHSDEASQTVTAMAAGQVDTHCVRLAVMHLGCTFINICGQTEQIQRINDLLTGLRRSIHYTGGESSSNEACRRSSLNSFSAVVLIT